ncbi:MAG: response regulator [Nitrospirae bacterium]|nr:response regulator [Nitrospirota bacterium]
MRKKILIVDNLEDMLAREKTILNRVSFEIFTASTGRDALSLHKEHLTDLMIISLDLPDMSGDKLCTSIRKDSDLRQVSIIMTCNNNIDCIERATHCGANAHITKPFHSGQLTEQVTKLLSIPQRQNYRVLIRISVKGTFSNEPFFCSSCDISSTGIRIETDRQLAKGDLLSCSFFLPGFGKVITEGEIVRTDNNGDTPRYGIRFRYLDPASRNGIDSFIANRSEQKI